MYTAYSQNVVTIARYIVCKAEQLEQRGHLYMEDTAAQCRTMVQCPDCKLQNLAKYERSAATGKYDHDTCYNSVDNKGSSAVLASIGQHCFLRYSRMALQPYLHLLLLAKPRMGLPCNKAVQQCLQAWAAIYSAGAISMTSHTL